MVWRGWGFFCFVFGTQQRQNVNDVLSLSTSCTHTLAYMLKKANTLIRLPLLRKTKKKKITVQIFVEIITNTKKLFE